MHQEKASNLDLADAYYNVACYHVLKYKDEASESEKERYKKEIIKALKKSFYLNPDNIKYSKDDKDLDVVRNLEEYISLT